MTWTDVYLLCFIVGFSLSVLSFLGGATHIHLPSRLHWPFQGGHHTGGMAGRGALHAPGGLGWFNALTIMTFLAWLGGLATWSQLIRGWWRSSPWASPSSRDCWPRVWCSSSWREL